MAAVWTCILLGGIRDGELGPAVMQLQGKELVTILIQHEVPVVTLATAADGGRASWWDHPRWLQEDGDCGAACTGREMLPDRRMSPVPNCPAVSLEVAPGPTAAQERVFSVGLRRSPVRWVGDQGCVQTLRLPPHDTHLV